MIKKEDHSYKKSAKDNFLSQKEILSKDDFESSAEKSRFDPDGFWDGETIYDE